MPRRKKHHLNRYATPIPDDLELVQPFALLLLDDASDLSWKTKAAACFAAFVRSRENDYRADPCSRMVQRLRWTNALKADLKAGGLTSHEYTAEMTLKIGIELHLLPARYKIESIAERVYQRHPSLGYDHLLKMARHLVIDADNAEDVQWNEQHCLQFAQLAVDEKWSPKKLESEIKKFFGLRAGGRPRKAK